MPDLFSPSARRVGEDNLEWRTSGVGGDLGEARARFGVARAIEVAEPLKLARFGTVRPVRDVRSHTNDRPK